MDFAFLYQTYFKDVYLYIRSMTANDSDAEEIAQETFFKALKALDQFDGRKDIRSWLFTIAKNIYFTGYKRQKAFPNQEVPEDLPDPRPDFTLYLEQEETAFQIHQYLHQMKEPYKEVFSLRIFGELPFEKIGTLFGKSPGWARVVYYRAKMQIKEYMEGLEHV